MEPRAAPPLIVPGPVVRALLEGEQVIDLRPAGGPPPSPPPGHPRLWLCPGGEDAALKPAYRLARRLSLPDEEPPPGQVRIEGWAELVGRATVRLDAGRAAALASKTVLDLDALSASAAGGEVEVLALRAHRLLEPLRVPSDLSGLPADPATSPSEVVLSDVAFDARLKGVASALPAGLSPG